MTTQYLNVELCGYIKLYVEDNDLRKDFRIVKEN